MIRNLYAFKRVLGSLAALLLVIASSKLHAQIETDAQPPLKVTMINVRHGLSVLIETPGGKVIMFDVADNDLSRDAEFCHKFVMPLLKSKNITKIDYLIISHHHGDHFNGMKEILQNFKVGQYMDNHNRGPTGTLRTMLTDLQIPTVKLAVGQRIAFETGLFADVLHRYGVAANIPTDGSEENNHSLVLKLHYKDTTMLLTGDLESIGESYLLDNYDPSVFKADVLQAGHHGMDWSSGYEWLMAVNPKIVLVPTGGGLAFSPWIREKIRMLGSQLYRTDQDGNIELKSDGKKFTVTKQIEAPVDTYHQSHATYQFNDGFTGDVIDTWSVNTRISMHFDKGELNGPVGYFTSGGKRLMSMNFVNGIRDGVGTFYYGNGKIWGQNTIVNGKLTGTTKIYDSAGNVWKTITYDNDGNMVKAQVFDETGKVVSEEFPEKYPYVKPTLMVNGLPKDVSVTVGKSAYLNVLATGNPGLTYRWKKNGNNISNGNSLKPIFEFLPTADDNGSKYTVTVRNSLGDEFTTAPVTLTVYSPPQIVTQPHSITVSAGQTATFSVVAEGNPAPAYQWTKNGVIIKGATSATYTTPVTTAADNMALFAVVVKNSKGTVTSTSAKLTVSTASSLSKPTITTQPVSKTVTAGQTATFTVAATGNPAPSYQWKKNGTNINGATGASYTTPVTVLADNNSSFTVIVSNSQGSVSSQAATLTVNPAPVAPTITTQPVSKTVTAGQTATFTVVATGIPSPTYQWKKNGANINNATSASYTTSASVLGDSGASFTVVVSNSQGSVTSQSATLTVNPAPEAPGITTQPASTTVVAGQTAKFTVVATGIPSPTYQWKKNGANIGNATGSSYTTPATSLSDSGATFTVVVSNSQGNVTSQAATLTVNPAPVAPTISTQPVSKTILAGQTATFSVVATGVPSPSYQWRKNGTNINNATSASYTTPAAVLGDSGSSFTVVVSNNQGTVTSQTATLTVNPVPVAPVITTEPASKSVIEGQTATFTVVATGIPSPTYQWKKNGANINNATSSSYTTPASVPGDSGASFTVVVSNSQGSVTSQSATLTVNPAPVAPTITTQPASKTVTAGQTATFSVVATGIPAPTYQWKKNGSNINNATSSSYTTPSTVVADSGGSYTVVVSNNQGTVTSQAATLTVNPAPVAPTITSQPVGLTVTEGDIAKFSVVAKGVPAPTYQWKRDGVNINGATANTYSLATSLADNNAKFTVVVKNSEGQVTSSAATLTVNPKLVAPSITSQPSNKTVTEGETATFSVVATGVPAPEYQWQKNGANIAGANASSYSTTVGLSDNNAQFAVIVKNSAGSVASHPAVVSVLPILIPPKILAQPASQTVKFGQTATFSVEATGQPAPAFQWKKNGVAIAGATATSYTTGVLSSQDSGSIYTVELSSIAGKTTSAPASLAVITPKVTSFTIINADTDKAIGILNEGDTLNLATLPTATLNFRANLDASPGSVAFKLNGPYSTYHVESGAPYAVFQNSGGSYSGKVLPSGSYALTAVPYSSGGAKGIAGTGLTINFNVINQPAPVIESEEITLPVWKASAFNIKASNNPKTLNLAGDLPKGLNFNSATGEFKGTPENAGSFEVTITGENEGGKATAKISFVIQPAKVLFVTDATFNPGDQAFKSKLESLSCVVSTVTDVDSKTEDAANKDLVVISSTCYSINVNTKFTDVKVPVLTWESHLTDDLKLSGSRKYSDYNTIENQTQIQIANNLFASASGVQSVYTTPGKMSWAKPGEGAIKIATLVNKPDAAVIFGYEAGASLVDGSPAQGKRTFVFLEDKEAATLTDSGSQLLDAAIEWSLK